MKYILIIFVFFIWCFFSFKLGQLYEKFYFRKHNIRMGTNNRKIFIDDDSTSRIEAWIHNDTITVVPVIIKLKK